MSDTNARFWQNVPKLHAHACRLVFSLSPVFASRNLTADSKVGLNQGAVSISFWTVTGSHAPPVGKHSMRSECKCKSLIISNIKKRTKSLFLCCKTWFLPISLHAALQPCCIRSLKTNKLSGMRQIYTENWNIYRQCFGKLLPWYGLTHFRRKNKPLCLLLACAVQTEWCLGKC